MTTEVVQDASQNRFQLLLDGEYVGETDYILRDDTIVFTHTIVPDEISGRGVAGELVRHALDDARSRDLTVKPQCSYVAKYIERHPEYEDLLKKG